MMSFLTYITGFLKNFELLLILTSNDYFIKILFLLSKWFQIKIFLWEFPIGSYVKLSSAVAAILVGVLLKIEISSNGQNCSILSQKMPKFELYKHNDELFNIYYGIFL
jgi:hypothetical protein